MSRGNRRQDIFLDDVDRIKTLAEACQKTAWGVHSFCLMSNQHHLVLETPNANLMAGNRRGQRRPNCGEELQRLGWSESELMLRRKNDPDKMGFEKGVSPYMPSFLD